MNHGFSLLEVIVALLIFSIAVLGIEKINIIAIQSMEKSYLQNRAAIQECAKDFYEESFLK